MAKTKAKTGAAQQAHPTTHQADPERWNRLLIVSAVVAVIAIAIGIVGFGWYWTQIRPFSKVVLRVESTEFTLGHLERRMSLWLEENAVFRQSQGVLQALGDITMDEIEREGKFLEAATELEGLSLSDEEIDAEILERGGNGENAILAEELNRLVRESGLNEGEYLQMVRAELLEEKAREHFTGLVPEGEEQVRFRWIVVDDDEDAQEALERLEAGEEFLTVVSDLSVDTASVEQNGEVDWRPRGGSPFVEDDVEDFLFQAEPGQRSGIISDGNGRSYIVELLEADTEREVAEAQAPFIAERLLADWLTGLDATLDVERDLSTEDSIRALSNVLS